jgi:hypothetical protein
MSNLEPAGRRFTRASELDTLAVMKKLIIVAVLIGLGIFAAQKLRSS